MYVILLLRILFVFVVISCPYERIKLSTPIEYINIELFFIHNKFLRIKDI